MKGPIYNILLLLSWNPFITRPMEEQRQRYGPSLYSLTKLALNIRLFLSLSWWSFDARKLWDTLQPLNFSSLSSDRFIPLCQKNMFGCVPLHSRLVALSGFNFILHFPWSRQRDQLSMLEEAVDVYTSEFERFVKFIRYIFFFWLLHVASYQIVYPCSCWEMSSMDGLYCFGYWFPLFSSDIYSVRFIKVCKSKRNFTHIVCVRTQISLGTVGVILSSRNDWLVYLQRGLCEFPFLHYSRGSWRVRGRVSLWVSVLLSFSIMYCVDRFRVLHCICNWFSVFIIKLWFATLCSAEIVMSTEK